MLEEDYSDAISFRCDGCCGELSSRRGLAMHCIKAHGIFTGHAARAVSHGSEGGLKTYLPKKLCEELNIRHGDMMIIVHVDREGGYLLIRRAGKGGA